MSATETDKQEYAYRGCVIAMRYSEDNDYCDAGWYWTAWKNGEEYGDNSKSCPDTSIENALFYAKKHIDWREEDEDDTAEAILLIES